MLRYRYHTFLLLFFLQWFLANISFAVTLASVAATLNLGNWTGQASLEKNDDICVLVQSCSGNTCTAQPYQVQGKGNGIAEAFTLTNQVQVLPYQVFFNDQI